MLTASLLRADVSSADLKTFNAQNYPGQWTLTTNQDGNITATESAVRRQGNDVFHRVLTLKIVSAEQLDGTAAQETFGSPENFAVTAELLDDLHHAASEVCVRNFIRQYRPPVIPYTSEATAEKTGREKFNCVEFAETSSRRQGPKIFLRKWSELCLKEKRPATPAPVFRQRKAARCISTAHRPLEKSADGRMKRV